jgi:uncharacterized damage-inducible protein DinB
MIDEQGRPEPPVAAGEVDVVLGFLDYQRATLEWKTRGLDAAALRATTAASTMTLGGILKHMAWVEGYWFGERLLGAPQVAPFEAVDWQADPNWEWTSAAGDEPDVVRSVWAAACDRARGHVRTALADGGMDHLAAVPWQNGDSPNLRWMCLHMIEEYARHNGHADLLREAVDGETGE